MVSKVLEGASQQGVQTELFCLVEKNAILCDGCLTCEETGRCHLRDDVQELYPRLLESDAIILGSPTHFDGVTAPLKNFIDRLNPICEQLEGKKGLVVTVGMLRGDEGKASRKRLIDYLKAVFEILEMEYVGAVEAEATTAREVASDKNVERECLQAGERLVQALIQGSDC